MTYRGPERRKKDRSGLRCPECGGYQQRVIESRGNSTGTQVRRRHECDCGHRFTSLATVHPTHSVSSAR